MLVKILYSYFSLANLTSLAQKIHGLLVSKFPDHPMISIVLKSLSSSMEVSVQAIGSTRKQPLTKSVREADLKRDNSYLSLKEHIQAGLRRENGSYRQACEALWVDFEKNDLKLYSLPDGDQTAAIDSLLKDLSRPKRQAHLETVHVVEWVQELDRDNRAFVVAAQQRSAIRSVDETVTDAEAIEQLKVSLTLLSHVMSALYAVNELEGIRDLVGEINQYIRESNASAKLSKALAASAREDSLG